MAKFTFVLLAIVAVVVLATTEVSAKSVEDKTVLAHKNEKITVGDSCDCDDCSGQCISDGYVGGFCYQSQCYCAYFN